MTAPTNPTSERFEQTASVLRQLATRADLAQIEARLRRWTVATMIAGMAATAAIGAAVRALAA